MNTSTFRAFWLGMSILDRKAFAARVGASYSTLNQHSSLGHSRRPLSAELAIAIERETGGRVRFESVRPDIPVDHMRGMNSACADH